MSQLLFDKHLFLVLRNRTNTIQELKKCLIIKEKLILES